MRGRQIAEDAQRREENVRGEKKGERSVFRSLKGLRRSDARKRTRKVEREREREREEQEQEGGNVNSGQKRK